MMRWNVPLATFIADFVMVYSVAALVNTGMLHYVQNDDSTGMQIVFHEVVSGCRKTTSCSGCHSRRESAFVLAVTGSLHHLQIRLKDHEMQSRIGCGLRLLICPEMLDSIDNEHAG